MTDLYIQYMVWADGYISAANMYDEQHRLAGHSTSHEARMRWLEKYCQDNPLDPFVSAVEHLREAM